MAPFPVEHYKEAIASKEQITPILLKILEEGTAKIQELLEQEPRATGSAPDQAGSGAELHSLHEQA